jgi:hypothetical protein
VKRFFLPTKIVSVDRATGRIDARPFRARAIVAALLAATWIVGWIVSVANHVITPSVDAKTAAMVLFIPFVVVPLFVSTFAWSNRRVTIDLGGSRMRFGGGLDRAREWSTKGARTELGEGHGVVSVRVLEADGDWAALVMVPMKHREIARAVANGAMSALHGDRAEGLAVIERALGSLPRAWLYVEIVVFAITAVFAVRSFLAGLG